MRIKHIDFLRYLALFYMFFQHAVIALLNTDDNNGIIKFFFDIVPICPALFLFVSGYSIIILYQKYKEKLIIKLLYKGIILILFSSLLFFIENGCQFPDIFFSSGILNTIGIMIILSAVILLLPKRIYIVSSLIIFLIILAYFFEKYKYMIFPFNNGYEPVSPTIIYGFIGLLIGLINFKIEGKYNKIFICFLGISGLFIFIGFFIFNSYFEVFDIAGRYQITRIFDKKFIILENLFLNENNSGIVFRYLWNYKMNNFFASLGVILLLFAVFNRLEKFLKNKIISFIILPGEFALINYFYHLTLLTVIVLISGFNEFSLIQFLIILLIIYIFSYIISYVLKYFKNRKIKIHQGMSPV